MKVCLVCHNFLPNHSAGTEVYTLQLGQELARRGHELTIFTAEKDIAREDLSVRERVYGGLRVVELINNLYYDDFRRTWDHPAIAARFAAFLDRERPDVAHFQHLWYLSAGCIEEAAERYIPILFTLHDYWLQCPRFGQRVHADTSICHTIDFGRCGECLASFKFAQSAAERSIGRLVAGVRSATGLDLGPLARGAGHALASLRERRDGAWTRPPADLSAGLAREAAERDRGLRERVLPLVHRFLSPSHFLRDRFVEWGIAPEKIRFLRTGIDIARFGNLERTRSDKLRVAFLGTLAPHKGAHILLDAWGRLDPALRAGAELALWGPLQYNQAYVAELERRAREVGARLAGPVPRASVPQRLCEIDLLVVPSIWYENSPLVIVEGIATRTPMLVSDLGGMAELVREGFSGWHFKVGDADDLARALARVIADRSLLAGLYRVEEPIKSVARDAEQIEELYFEAVESVRTQRLAAGR